MHVPHVSDAVDPGVIVLLNLSRDQLDRVGEINMIERTLRAGLANHPTAVVVANCDDVLMTSAGYDSPHVVWVAAGGSWSNDSVSCPRSGEVIVREHGHWYSTGADFKRPSPQWWYDDDTLYGPDGLALPMRLALPGVVNRGNAAPAVAAAPSRGAPIGRKPWRPCPPSTKSPGATGPCASAATTPGSCWPRTRPAGPKRCRWWASMRPASSSLSTGRFPTAKTCHGCGMCASNISTRRLWWPQENAAPTWPCGWDTPVSSTRWCTTPWRPSHPARPAGWKSSPTTPRSFS